MTGVDRGSMFTPSALISTDTEDGHAEKEREEEYFNFLKDFKIVLTSIKRFLYGPNIIY